MSLSLEKFKQCRILVIGDVMLDRYLWGGVKRISPEAPVPVFHIKKRSIVPGGAGNVVLNLIGLGASVTLIGIIGDDENGRSLNRMFEDQKIKSMVIKDDKRPTITKTRIVSNGQQLLRIDDENSTDLDGNIKTIITERVTEQIPKHDAVILSDYGKGIFQTTGVTEKLIKKARNAGIPVIVDPKGNDWARYKEATCVTPNTAEFELVFGSPVADENDLLGAMSAIRSKFSLSNLLVTRGSLGMCLVGSSRKPHFIPAIARQIYDVSGAGDTVVAVLTAGIAAGLDFPDAAKMANIAAGVVVGKIGTQPINLLELKAAVGMKNDSCSGIVNHKLCSPSAAAVQVQAWKAANQSVVFTNGCFDLLHPGHIHLLNESKKCGDRLIVGLNSDDSVRRLKGMSRPILSESDRAAILGALDSVDLVILFDEDTPLGLIDFLKPDILVKGADYRLENVVGKDVVESYGGKVHLVSVLQGHSTTNIANKIAIGSGA